MPATMILSRDIAWKHYAVAGKNNAGGALLFPAGAIVFGYQSAASYPASVEISLLV